MYTRVVSILAAAASALALAFTATPAKAATWTISGSSATGTVTGHALNPTLTDVNSGVQLTCTSSDATGTVQNGVYSSGTDIGEIDSLTFTGCTGPLGLTFTVTTGGFPWPINAIALTSGGVSGTITGIQAHLTGAGCDATIAGSVPIIFTGATLVVLAQGNTLTVTNVSASNNCFGLIRAGDVVQFAATYMLTPSTINITSP